MAKIIITNPRGHRSAWAAAHPRALIENGGILSKEDLDRWACDLCMAPLDPSKPIPVIDDFSLCQSCAAKHDIKTWPHCRCVGCENAG